MQPNQKPLQHSLTPAERIIAGLDDYPLMAIWRIALGFLFPLLYQLKLSAHTSQWSVVVWFLILLLCLRLVPVLLRKLVPFSSGLMVTWEQRRSLAKIYDSYQWAKLIWFGLGIALYMSILGGWNEMWGLLVLFSVLGGGCGLAIWQIKYAVRNRPNSLRYL
jgi:hypothetical protein